MEHITLDNVLTLISWIVTVLTFITAVLKARKDKKTLSESLTLAVNVLKVEDKMGTDGQFKNDIIQKTEVAAHALQVGTEAKEQVVKVLAEGHEHDIKLGSIRGNPIYLGDVAGVGSALAAALIRLRGLRK